MKVLYIGVYKDGTGWGNAAQNNILALDAVGVDVVPRAITLTPNDDNVDVPQRILELEENDEAGCDICIQHLLPNMMEYNGHFDKNVGIFYYETDHFRNTNWAQYLNMMDQVWVCNSQMMRCTLNSNVTSTILTVPLCCDVSKYGQRYTPYPISATDDRFVFYTVGEVIRRKNLAGLLKAFHLEFTPNEPVCLMIKGNVTGQSPMDANRIIKAIVDEVKNGLRLYPSPIDYHNEIIITQWLDDEKMMRLHKTGDCFVLPSFGEAWGMPGFDAMALGNPVIMTNEGGPADYVENGLSGLLVPCSPEPVFMRPEEVPAPDIWTGTETWSAPNLTALRADMRSVYEQEALRKTLGENGIDRAYDYSYAKIGALMKKHLEAEPCKSDDGIISVKSNISHMLKRDKT